MPALGCGQRFNSALRVRLARPIPHWVTEQVRGVAMLLVRTECGDTGTLAMEALMAERNDTPKIIGA